MKMGKMDKVVKNVNVIANGIISDPLMLLKCKYYYSLSQCSRGQYPDEVESAYHLR